MIKAEVRITDVECRVEAPSFSELTYAVAYAASGIAAGLGTRLLTEFHVEALYQRVEGGEFLRTDMYCKPDHAGTMANSLLSEMTRHVQT